MPMIMRRCRSDEGVGARDVDTVMKLQPSDEPADAADFIWPGRSAAISTFCTGPRMKYRPCPLLRRMVAAGHLGRKSGRGFYAY